MATPIRIKRSAVPGKRPQVTDLQVGELALNTYDAELVTLRQRHFVHKFVSAADNSVNVITGIQSGTEITPSSASYVTSTGVLTLTFGSNHNLVTGDKVTLDDNSIVFQCEADNYKTDHSYPRPTDPIGSGVSVGITTLSTTVLTLDVGVGYSTEVVRVGAGATVKSIIYVTKDGNDTNTGLRLGDAKATIKNAIGFATDGDVVNVSAGVYIEDNPIDVPKEVSLVGDSLREVTITPKNADKDLFYVGPASMLQELSFSGTVNSGVAAVAFNPDKIEYSKQSPYIRFCTNKLTNSIGMKVDGSKSIGPFRSMVTDSYTQYNANGIGVSLSNEGYAQIVSMFTMNLDVGIAANSGGQCDVTNSNSSFGNYGMISDGIGPLKYTGIISATQVQGKDQFVVHLPAYDRSISNAIYDSKSGLLTATTYQDHGFTVGSGVTLSKFGFTCSYGDYDHTLVSVANTAVVIGGEYTHEFVSATSDAVNVITGTQSDTELDPTSASYTADTGILTLTFGSNHNLVTGDKVTLDDNSIVFKCSRDNYATKHSYPRPTDPIGSGVSVGITTTGLTTIELNVGISTFVSLGITTTSSTYTANTGDLVLYVGAGHSFTQSTSHTISTATYTPSSGVLAVTVNSHGFSEGDYVKINPNSLTFKCSRDSYATNHSYPRITDPVYNKWLPISNTSTNTFEVNVGSTSNLDTHELQFTSPNGLVKANSNIGIATNTFTFTCSKDSHATQHTYPRTTDPAHNAILGIGATDTNTITVNVGVSTYDTFPSGIYGNIFEINSIPTSKSFTAYVGPNRHPHNYVSGGSAKLDIIRPFDGQVIFFDTLYKEVLKIAITDGGSGYTTPPAVTIDSPPTAWGIQATAVAEISDGKVINIDIVSNGRGYTSNPSITIDGNATASLTMTNKYYSITKSTPISNGISTITVSDNLPYAVGLGVTVPFYKQSRIIASSHSFEYIGTGVDPLNSLPSRGAVPIQDNEIDDRNGGLTIFTSTDQKGEFRIGDGVVINQQTGTITGKDYSKSLFSTMTPFILALGGD